MLGVLSIDEIVDDDRAFLVVDDPVFRNARLSILGQFFDVVPFPILGIVANDFHRQVDSIPGPVEAACSKHRKQDVLPLHFELVRLLTEWLPVLKEEEYLFPKLEKKKTWLMVKKDLERVGIPYKTQEGVPDFHAAGRHSHITEVIRSGATLTEARGLARHGDIRMTMRYTHVGIEDQANALASLQSPLRSNEQREDESQQCSSSAQGVPGSQNVSSSGNPGQSESAKENPCFSRGSHQKSSSDNECQKWRRRESNERNDCTQLLYC